MARESTSQLQTKRAIKVAFDVIVGLAFNHSRQGQDSVAQYYQRIANGLSYADQRRKCMEVLLRQAAKTLPTGHTLKRKITRELSR